MRDTHKGKVNGGWLDSVFKCHRHVPSHARMSHRKVLIKWRWMFLCGQAIKQYDHIFTFDFLVIVINLPYKNWPWLREFPHLLDILKYRETGKHSNLTHTHTLLFHSSLGVSHCLPGTGDVQEDGICHTHHTKPLLAYVLVPYSDQVTHTVLPKLFGCLFRPLLVKLHCVQVTRGRNGAQDGMGQRPTPCTCIT